MTLSLNELEIHDNRPWGQLFEQECKEIIDKIFSAPGLVFVVACILLPFGLIAGTTWLGACGIFAGGRIATKAIMAQREARNGNGGGREEV